MKVSPASSAVFASGMWVWSIQGSMPLNSTGIVCQSLSWIIKMYPSVLQWAEVWHLERRDAWFNAWYTSFFFPYYDSEFIFFLLVIFLFGIAGEEIYIHSIPYGYVFLLFDLRVLYHHFCIMMLRFGLVLAGFILEVAVLFLMTYCFHWVIWVFVNCYCNSHLVICVVFVMNHAGKNKGILSYVFIHFAASRFLDMRSNLRFLITTKDKKDNGYRLIIQFLQWVVINFICGIWSQDMIIELWTCFSAQ
jgi:hypothetical protein